MVNINKSRGVKALNEYPVRLRYNHYFNLEKFKQKFSLITDAFNGILFFDEGKKNKKIMNVLKDLNSRTIKNNIRKTSHTVGTVEAKLNGKNITLRVDVEPDSNKIQIQYGKGTSSLVDIRLSDEDKDITYEELKSDFIPRNISLRESQLEKLFRLLRKAFKHLL